MSKSSGKSEITSLAGALAQIEREFGEGSMRVLGDGQVAAVKAIPTGALSLDLALGIGGVPRGRIVELYGPESSGKTTLAYHLIAEAQRLGGRCAFIDAEHAMDPAYAAAIGVETDELLLSQPDYGEAALEIVDLLARSGEIAVIVVDSAAALVPRAELEGKMGDQVVGLQSRMMSQAMRKLAGHLRASETLCLFTNQLRERIGVVYGPKETQPGGRALKYYASQRLDIRRIESLKDGNQAIGNRVRVKVAKNKVAAPFGVAEFDIDFGRGISRVGCVLDLAVEAGVVKRSGPHFAYGSERLGQGRAKAKALLEERPELVEAIAREVREGLTEDSDSERDEERRPDEDATDASRDEDLSAAAQSQEEGPTVKVEEVDLVVAV
jgi:recombination protein RecA